MRFVILNHCYEDFLDWLYAHTPGLEQESFQAQLDAYYATLFGSSDFWVRGLRELGNQVDEIVCNNMRAQTAWLREHPASSRKSTPAKASTGSTPHWRKFLSLLSQVRLRISRYGGHAPLKPFELVLEQVNEISPDIIYVQSVFAFDNDQLRTLKGMAGLVIGEHAAMPLPETIDYRLYDMIVSSFPPTIDWLRGRGVRAELNRLAFDQRLVSLIPECSRDVRVSFAGSFLPVHRSRLELIEAVATRITDISIHGNVAAELSASSTLAGKIKPALWGREMYALLRRSMITLNHHGDVPPFANNMRLYEATGMGCLLMTDYKENLQEMFEPDREVVAYGEPGECIDKLLFYLDDRNAAAREKIAAAGQRRTLREHTYQARMKHLIDLIQAN